MPPVCVFVICIFLLNAIMHSVFVLHVYFFSMSLCTAHLRSWGKSTTACILWSLILQHLALQIDMIYLVLKVLPEDSRESQTARVLLYKLFYDQTEHGLTQFLLNLFRSFDSHKQPKRFVRNIPLGISSLSFATKIEASGHTISQLVGTLPTLENPVEVFRTLSA